jgi:hypothetical protein
MSIPTFLSYSHKDRKLAALTKKCLDSYTFDTFLAHEDLQPSEEWQETILRRLKKCVVFIPLLTSAFSKSDWTDQETGIAVGLRKVIVPFKVARNPYGFISKYQAQLFNEEVIEEACWKVIKRLGTKRKLEDRIRDGVIHKFGLSRSFEASSINAKKLKVLEPFNKEQLNEIVRLSAENSQIYAAYVAPRYVRELIRAHKSNIDAKQLRKFLKLSSPE